MILQPDFIYHPKYLALRRRVGIGATDYLVRLWTHCQQNQRGQFWRNADASYVEEICTGKPQGGKVFAALVECGWITEREGGIEVHDWEEHNYRYVARWKKKRPGGVQDASTMHAPCVHDASTTHTPCAPEENRNRREEKRVEEKHNNSDSFTPSLEQAIAWCQKNDPGYSKEEIRVAWLSLESTKHPDGFWIWGKNMVTDWRMALLTRIELLKIKNSARPPATDTAPANGSQPIDDSMFKPV